MELEISLECHPVRKDFEFKREVGGSNPTIKDESGKFSSSLWKVPPPPSPFSTDDSNQIFFFPDVAAIYKFEFRDWGPYSHLKQSITLSVSVGLSCLIC